MDAKGYGEFRGPGWQIVLASLLGIGLGLSPMPFYTLGVFRPHLTAAFGWTPGQIMGALTVTSLMVLWAGPVVGLVAIRYGVRRVALISVVLFGLAFMALGLSTGSLPLYYATWALVAILGAGTLPITWTRAVNHWFDVRKGLALGLSLMGTGIFGFVAKPFTAWLIASFGWRAAFVGLGLLPLLIALPVAFLLFYDRGPGGAAATTAAPVEGLTLRQTLGEWRFWVIAAALLPISFALGGPVPNMEDILRSGGVPPASILTLTSFIGLSALSGRFIGGWLLDRFWAPAVAVVILCLPGVSLWVLAHGPLDYWAALLSIALIGFALGVEYDLVAYFVARYFGMRSYTAIYGLLYVAFSLGAGIGPLAFGWSFGRTGSFDTILTVSAGLLFAGALSFLTLGAYRRFDTSAAAAPPAIQPVVTAAHSPMAGR